MTREEKTAAVEAILFASGEPMEAGKIAEALEIGIHEVRELAEELISAYGAGRGISIVRLDDAYQMCSSRVYAPQVRKALEIRRNTPLSSAAMEVLAIVAYNQPVTKAFMEQVRGVDCSGVVGSLMAKGLIEERGRLELPGRPLLYGTTPNFLRCMGVSSLEELPPLKGESGQEPEQPDNEQITLEEEIRTHEDQEPSAENE